VEAAAKAMRISPGKALGITISDAYQKGSDRSPRWPHLRPTLSPEQIGQHIGRLLAQQALGALTEVSCHGAH
jgi:hypothetical protein